jgi:hypothetical protein
MFSIPPKPYNKNHSEKQLLILLKLALDGRQRSSKEQSFHLHETELEAQIQYQINHETHEKH